METWNNFEGEKKLINRPVVILVITDKKQFYNGRFIHEVKFKTTTLVFT